MANSIDEGFNLKLAIVDSLPVLFFAISVSILSLKISNLYFYIGAFLIILAGALKVSWKFVLALKKKDIRFLFLQMRVVMPIGFILAIYGVTQSNFNWASFLGMPSLLFLIMGLLCMCAMFYFLFHNNQSSSKDNWKEEIVNCCGQLCIMLAIIFLKG